MKKLVKSPEDTIGTPDMHFFVYESYMVFDHKKEKIHVIEDALYSERSQEALEKSLNQVLRNYAFLLQMNLKTWIYHHLTSNRISLHISLREW